MAPGSGGGGGGIGTFKPFAAIRPAIGGGGGIDEIGGGAGRGSFDVERRCSFWGPGAGGVGVGGDF